MKSALLLASIGMLAAAVSTSSLGGERDHRHDRAHADRNGSGGMQAVSTGAAAGEPGHGWRYFTDPAAHRAVVISPQGEYYYSRGKGLVLVAVTQPVS